MASKNRRNKVKFKLTKELVFLLAGIVVLIVAAILINIPTAASKRLDKYNDAITAYNTENSTSYYTLTEENVYDEISIDGLKNTKNSSSYTYVLYGTLTNAVFLENLYYININAKDADVKRVYILFASYVDEASDETKASVAYKDEINAMSAKINDSVDQDQSKFDFEKFPALLVFKDNKLIFNSQTYSESDKSEEYNWKEYIKVAFSFEKSEEAKTIV